MTRSPIILRAARPSDEGAVRSLLRRFDLPDEDIADHLPRFVIACDGEEIAGVAGIEVLGRYGLLRSLAVSEERRDQGIASALVNEILRRVRGIGVRDLYLLTTTAEGYFSRRGFRVVARTEAPEEIRETEEFRRLCPDKAVFMHASLDVESQARCG